MFYVLKRDPVWLTLPVEAEGGSVSLLSEDGCQVSVPTVLLLAASPLLRAMVTGLHTSLHCPLVISFEAVSVEVLLAVREILSKGVVAVEDDRIMLEVQLVFNNMGLVAFLSCCKIEHVGKDHIVEEKNVEDEVETGGKEQGIIDTEMDVKIEMSIKQENLVDYRSVEDLTDNSEHENLSEKFFKSIIVHKYKCNCCDYSCTRRCDLEEHSIKHFGVKRFSCDKCEFKTGFTWKLLRHKKIHSGKKPFSCDDCEYTFVFKDNLLRHKRIHSGEKPFECDDCDYKTSHKQHLSRHKKTHHSTRE